MLLLALCALATAADVAPGVIVDPSARFVYVASPSGGLDALRADTGERAWRSAAIDRPLAATGGLVVGWLGDPDGHTLQVVGVHAADGRVAVRCAPIAVPEWVHTGVVDVLGRSTEVDVVVHADAIEVFWEAGASYAGGAPPPPEVEAAASASAQGSGRCDLATGAWRADPQPSPAPRVREGFLDAEGRFVDAARAAEAWLVTRVTSDGADTAAHLDRWDAAGKERVSTVELARGPRSTWPHLSLDRTRVAVVIDGRSEVFDLDGRRLYAVPAALVRWAQVGDRALLRGPDGIQAWDTAGTLRWSAPVRSFDYDGPIPP